METPLAVAPPLHLPNWRASSLAVLDFPLIIW
jgi:hypothetical protein